MTSRFWRIVVTSSSRIEQSKKNTESQSRRLESLFLLFYTGVLISPYPDQEGKKLGSMSGTRAVSTTSRRELLSSFFFPCKARRRRKFKPFWQKHELVSFLVGLRTYQRTCKRWQCELWSEFKASKRTAIYRWYKESLRYKFVLMYILQWYRACSSEVLDKPNQEQIQYIT